MEVAARREIPTNSHAMHVNHATVEGSFSSTQELKCTHSELAGHTVDRRYYLIGFSVGREWHRKNVKPRNKKPTAHKVELKKEPHNDIPTFTAEEYKHIMASLNEKNGDNQLTTNATGTFTPSCNNIEHDAHSTSYWIVDSGATDHVSHLSLTHNEAKTSYHFIAT